MLLRMRSGQYEGVKNKRFKSEKEVERIIMKVKNLEDIIEEELLIIGCNMTFDNINDELDILALDRSGNLVIGELKKSFQSNATHTDFQTSKYAGFVSAWSVADIKEQFEGYIYNTENRRVNFEKIANDFLDVDISFINQHQRIILIGSKENERLNIACNWLYEQGVDIAIYNLEKYVADDYEFIVSNKLIPGKKSNKYGPSLDGHYDKQYHLNKCSYKTKQLIEAFVEIVKELHNDFEGPDWSNKTYVSFRRDGKNVVEVRINQRSIAVTINNSYNNPFDKKEVKKKLEKRLDFPIEDRINL